MGRVTTQWRLVASVAVLAVLCAATLAAAAFLGQGANIAHYPGADIISDQSVRRGFPGPQVKRTTSYRTQDPFPRVYQWYSNRFQMGAEQQAQSGCTHLFSTRSATLFFERVSVTVCETVEGRLVFVQRAVGLDLP